MSDNELGAILESAPADRQIVQQDSAGRGRMTLTGRCAPGPDGAVEVRLVWEATGVPVASQGRAAKKTRKRSK